MLNFGFKRKHNSVPRAGLLLYLGRPNLEAADVPIGDDTEIGDDTIIRWMFLLPADADIRSATGWVSGVGNIFYDAAGDPVAVLASEIAAWSSTNQWNVLFHLVSADTETGRLAIYAQDTPLVILNKALKVLREDQIDVSPSAFFNGEDFRLATYTGGPTYVPDHIGVLRSPGANRPAVQGMRLDGVTYINTDESGNPILPSTPQKTVTYNTDWTAKTFAETFAKFDISDPLKAPGWLCEPVRTNKCTCRKANPVDTTNTIVANGFATFSVVNDTFGYINSAGLNSTCNTYKLYKIDNSGFDTSSIVGVSGVTANTNNHSISCYAIAATGSAKLRINFIDYTSISTSAFSLVTAENKTVSFGSTFAFNIAPRTIVYFILPQLEEGPFCTSPICKDADGSNPLTGLTRSATVVSFPTAGKIPVNDFAIRMIAVPRASEQSGVYCFGSYVDSGNYTAIIVNPTSIMLRKRVASANTDASVSITHASGVPLDLILYSSSISGMQIAVRSFSSSWGAFTDGSANSATAAKANAPIAATYQLGALAGSNQFTGNISSAFECVPIPSGITDPMAWAKTHWGMS